MTEPAPEPVASTAATPEPARIEDLLLRTQRFIRSSIAGSLEEPLDGVKRRLATSAVGLTVSLVLVGGACLFFMAAALMWLLQYLTPAGACLVVGAFALLAGALSFTLTTRR
jgi:hypothetical protein